MICFSIQIREKFFSVPSNNGFQTFLKLPFAPTHAHPKQLKKHEFQSVKEGNFPPSHFFQALEVYMVIEEDSVEVNLQDFK